MPLDDRDRSFEKALALRLRANSQAADCPDAETLAAYHERSLTPDELTSWKSHIASCANCQQILAHLETLDEIPLGALTGQDAIGEASELVGAVAIGSVTNNAAAALAAAAPKKAAVVSMAQVPKQRRITHWRWIVPVGAIAAGLFVWVAVHENRPTEILPSAKIEIAQNQPSATAPNIAASEPGEREKLDKAVPFSKALPPTGDRASDSSASALQNRRDISAAKAAAPAPLDRRAGGVATDVAGAAAGGIATTEKEKKSDEAAQQDQAMNYVAAPAPAAPKPQSAGQAGVPSRQKDEKQLQADQTSGVPAPPQTEAKQAPENADALAAKQQVLAETVTVTSGAAATPAMRMAKSRAPRSVFAPGGKVIWRLGFGGLIEQSIDGGQTWTPQTSGTTETLFLGSAPSEQVCWVISTTGTILHTTDSGATWLSVVSPIQQNLALIRASDALHATVWDMSRRHIFETSDGGATWIPVPAH